MAMEFKHLRFNTTEARAHFERMAEERTPTPGRTYAMDDSLCLRVFKLFAQYGGTGCSEAWDAARERFGRDGFGNTRSDGTIRAMHDRGASIYSSQESERVQRNNERLRKIQEIVGPEYADRIKPTLVTSLISALPKCAKKTQFTTVEEDEVIAVARVMGVAWVIRCTTLRGESLDTDWLTSMLRRRAVTDYFRANRWTKREAGHPMAA